MDIGWNIIILVVAWLVVGALVGFLAGRARGREEDGLKLGAFLGPVGWLITLCLSDQRLVCPKCGGVVAEGASKCCHCCSDIEPAFRIHCPKCNTVVRTPISYFGKQVQCPKCRKTFVAHKE